MAWKEALIEWTMEAHLKLHAVCKHRGNKLKASHALCLKFELVNQVPMSISPDGQESM